MEYIGDVVYDYGGGLYVNMTNRCPCRCEFCIRTMTDSLGGADSLWLKREPTAEELIGILREKDLDSYDEIVFCGYGEPTERIDCLKAVCEYVRSHTDLSTRLNTNGLSDLINGRDTTTELADNLDAISISLNAPTAAEYGALCHPRFGEESFDAILDFTGRIKEKMKDVTMSVVSGWITPHAVEECRIIAERNLKVKFRVR